MRRLSVFGIVSLMASLFAVVGTSGPAWASDGASLTSVCSGVVPCSPAGSRYGEVVHFGAEVDDHSASCPAISCDVPTGTVEFYDNGAPSPFTTCVLQEYLHSGHVAVCTGDYAGLTVGVHDVFAKYVPSGANPFDESADTTRYEVDVQPTTTSLTDDPATTVYGQPVQFTATVTPNERPFTGFGASPPGGLVEFLVNGSFLATVGVNSGTGTATYTTSALTAGNPTLTARYISDGNYGTSTSSSITHSVSPASTTGTLVVSTTSPTFGQPLTLTDTVAPVSPGAGTPTSDVTFLDLTLGSIVSSQPLDLQNPDRAAFTTSTLDAGPHTLRADYRGEPDFLHNASNQVTVTVSKANTTTDLRSSLNPSAFGQAVTFTATLAAVAPGVGTPDGVVQFTDGGANLGSPQTLVGGVATLTSAALGGGTHAIGAVYAGASNYNGSSTALVQTVTCARTITGSVRTVVATTAGATCLSNAHVSGGLTIPSGANVSIVNSTVGGVITGRGGAGAITICGSTVGGRVQISHAIGFVLIGDPLDDACAGNNLRGSVTLYSNTGGVELGANTIAGNVNITGTSGTGPFADDARAEVEANGIGGTLACSGNVPSAGNDGQPNNVSGRRKYECAGL